MDQCKCVRQTREGEATDLAKCPFCGSAPDVGLNASTVDAHTAWLCRTWRDGGGDHQSPQCKIKALEATVLARELTVTDLKCDLADAKADNARLSGDLAVATQAGTPYARERDYQNALELRVTELEAEVAARAARCALLAVALNVAHDSLDPLSGCAASISQMITETLATPDLAAARLLAADALAKACRDKPPRAIAGPGLHCCWFCGADYSHKEGCLFVAYGEAVAAEEKADAT